MRRERSLAGPNHSARWDGRCDEMTKALEEGRPTRWTNSQLSWNCWASFGGRGWGTDGGSEKRHKQMVNALKGRLSSTFYLEMLRRRGRDLGAGKRLLHISWTPFDCPIPSLDSMSPLPRLPSPPFVPHHLLPPPPPRPLLGGRSSSRARRSRYESLSRAATWPSVSVFCE